MARWFIRKFSIRKILGAYKSQWKRLLGRFTRFGYGVRGMGWWRDPKRAIYNFWYNRTSVSLTRLFGGKGVRGASLFGALIACLFVPEETTQTKRTGASSRRNGKSTGGRSLDGESNAGKSPDSKPTCDGAGSDLGLRQQTTRRQREKRSAQRAEKNSATPKPTAKPAVQSKLGLAAEAVTVQASPPPLRTSQEEILPEIKPEPSWYIEPVVSKVDEVVPKSTPKHPDDQYIRKRMEIAGMLYGNQEVLNQLQVGEYVELVAESNHPDDKNAVMLLCRGKKIGYVPEQESFSFATCIKLKQAVYGVITDIARDEKGVVHCEFETWFARHK